MQVNQAALTTIVQSHPVNSGVKDHGRRGIRQHSGMDVEHWECVRTVDEGLRVNYDV